MGTFNTPLIACLLSVVVGLPSLSGAQTARCTTLPSDPDSFGACGWAQGPSSALTRLGDHADHFADALLQFVGALEDRCDTGERLAVALRRMHEALAAWDRELRQAERDLAPAADDVQARLALGVAYLVRGRVDSALGEFVAARLADPRRAEPHALEGMALRLRGRNVEAARAFARVLTIVGSDPALLYDFSQFARSVGLLDDAADAVGLFHASPWRDLLERRRREGPADFRAPPLGRLTHAPHVLPQSSSVPVVVAPVHYQAAFQLIDARRYDEALAAFTSGAAADPLAVKGPLGALLNSGCDALRMAQLEIAIERFAFAVQRFPGSAEAHRRLALAYQSDEQYERSVLQFRNAIALDGSDERSRLGLAEVLAESGDLAAAEQEFRDAAAAIPRSKKVLFGLAQLHRRTWRDAEAVQELNAVRDGVVAGRGGLLRAIVDIRKGQVDLDRAAEAAMTWIGAAPNEPQAHLALSAVFSEQGAPDAALAESLAALVIDPASADAYALSAVLFQQKGQEADAAAFSQRALELDPRHQQARYSLGTSLLRLGRRQQGVDVLTEFRRIQSDALEADERQRTLEALEREALDEFRRGAIEKSVALFEQVLSFDPRRPSSHVNLAVALLKIGRAQPALDTLLRLRVLKDDAEIHRLLAQAYAALGRADDERAESSLYRRAKAERASGLVR